MKRLQHIALVLSPVILSAGCSETPVPSGAGRAIIFDTRHDVQGHAGMTRSDSPAVFDPGDRIGVFASYNPDPEGGDGDFVPDFMNNQIVSFDGTGWSYSPLKYWPHDGSVRFFGYFPYDKGHDVDDGFSYRTVTGLEPLYVAHCSVKSTGGELSGDGAGADGTLRLGFTPLLNRVNFNARAADNLFDEEGEFKDCRFLIREFRVSGFYSSAAYDINALKWGGYKDPFTAAAPLDMTRSLASVSIPESVPGYVYDPSAGYSTDRAVIVEEDGPLVNLFGKSAYFIPMDGVISGNEPMFEVVYVVLTNRTGENVYKESGIVTRTGSLRDIFAGAEGLIRKNINVNLTFSVDGVTVTRDFTDYIYKPMF